jgi:hypothetical protein
MCAVLLFLTMRCHPLRQIGMDKGSYYHAEFLRSHRALADNIERMRIKGKGPRKPSAPLDEPNFYDAPFLPCEQTERLHKPSTQLQQPAPLVASENNVQQRLLLEQQLREQLVASTGTVPQHVQDPRLSQCLLSSLLQQQRLRAHALTQPNHSSSLAADSLQAALQEEALRRQLVAFIAQQRHQEEAKNRQQLDQVSLFRQLLLQQQQRPSSYLQHAALDDHNVLGELARLFQQPGNTTQR